MKEEIEDTLGYQIAIGFKPFINPECTEHIEIVKSMAKAINGAFMRATQPNEMLVKRVKQTLTSLDYEQLTDFQAKCILLLEKELNRTEW